MTRWSRELNRELDRCHVAPLHVPLIGHPAAPLFSPCRWLWGHVEPYFLWTGRDMSHFHKMGATEHTVSLRSRANRPPFLVVCTFLAKSPSFIHRRLREALVLTANGPENSALVPGGAAPFASRFGGAAAWASRARRGAALRTCVQPRVPWACCHEHRCAKRRRCPPPAAAGKSEDRLTRRASLRPGALL